MGEYQYFSIISKEIKVIQGLKNGYGNHEGKVPLIVSAKHLTAIIFVALIVQCKILQYFPYNDVHSYVES